MKDRREIVAKKHKSISKRRRAEILAVNLSSLYLKPKKTSMENINLMNEIQDIYAVYSFKGYRRICNDLNDLGYNVNHKRVLRLMRIMKLQAVYPKKNLSKRRQGDAVFPYLLKEHPPLNPHDCWGIDITYIRLSTGFVYLTALIDVVSRHIMGWNVSINLDTKSCLKALKMALESGFKPKIVNSDQGCQFTSADWVAMLAQEKIRISMVGKGRCLDNVHIERFWRSIKYEEVYLKSYEGVAHARQEIGKYIAWYNTKRRHQGLGYQIPFNVMNGIEVSKKITGIRPAGYVDNLKSKLTTYPRGPTTTTSSLNAVI